MYLHFLGAVFEDLPFCVLNMMLVLVPRRDGLLCSETTPSKTCREWLDEQGNPTLVILIFVTSICALTYKASQVMAFPTIWAEHKQLEREARELDEWEAKLLTGHAPQGSSNSMSAVETASHGSVGKPDPGQSPALGTGPSSNRTCGDSTMQEPTTPLDAGPHFPDPQQLRELANTVSQGGR